MKVIGMADDRIVDSGNHMNRGAAPSEREEDMGNSSRLPAWARICLWLLRKSIVPIIMAAMLLAGLYAGFVFLGKGSSDEVFEWATWRHLYDLVFADS